jgi:hypothetical protein
MNSPRPVATSCRITVAGSHFKYSAKKKYLCPGSRSRLDPDLIGPVNTDPGLNKRKKCRKLMYVRAGFLFGGLDAYCILERPSLRPRNFDNFSVQMYNFTFWSSKISGFNEHGCSTLKNGTSRIVYGTVNMYGISKLVRVFGILFYKTTL